jgi:hypothetical protein
MLSKRKHEECKMGVLLLHVRDERSNSPTLTLPNLGVNIPSFSQLVELWKGQPNHTNHCPNNNNKNVNAITVYVLCYFTVSESDSV